LARGVGLESGQGPITAQTIPVGARTASDGTSAVAERNLGKSSQKMIVFAPAQRCYGSAIDLGPVEEKVIVCFQASIIWYRPVTSRVEASLVDALQLLSVFL
jgi:hypothetical protein